MPAAATHGFGRARQQLAEDVQRNVEAQAELFKQRLVTIDLVGEARISVFGETCAGILNELDITCWLPRSIRVSVTPSSRLRRIDIAIKWCWLLVFAMSIRSREVRRSDIDRMGPATAISSLRASD